MRKHKKSNHKIKIALFTGAGVLVSLAPLAHGQNSVDNLLDKLEKKGVLTADEANELKAENAAEQTNNVTVISAPPVSKWKMSDAIKSIALFGDLRLRYEYRGVENLPGASPRTFYRERFRYALRFGIRGDLYDNFYYGLRLETSTNPRSPWDTFGNNTTAGSVTPSDKAQSGINIGQAYVGWRPFTWYEMTAGRMAMPLYTTPMVWDSDINPEGAFEKFKYTIGDVDLFADFAQFDYQDPSSAVDFPTSDTFILAWQAGAQVNLSDTMFFKMAPMVYTYAGEGSSGGLNQPFVGQGNAGVNTGVPGGAGVTPPGPTDYNEQGLDHLVVMEVPAEFDIDLPVTPLGPMHGRLFGDFAYNFEGSERADAAYDANPGAFPGLSGPVEGQNKAYQIGIGFGSEGPLYGPTQGLVYGSTSKKNTWEARFYWQHIEQYSLDVNLIDSDFFEGRGNLEGFYAAFAYSITYAIIGTVRIGYANRINDSLGTGGNNLDIPGINPIKDYKLLQTDLTWRF
jgi:hypothetical protein